MSHITTIRTQVRDLDALRQACQRLGLEFREGQRTYKTYASVSGCDHAIRVPGANYEVGVVHQEDHYALSWDPWSSGGLERALGPDAQQLKQAYAVEAATLEAQRQGHSVWEEPLEDGSVRLHVQLGEV